MDFNNNPGFFCFVVWINVNGKPKNRVVVDIRALNKITMPDAYPVFSQTEILSQIKNSKFISVVDAANFFYQWWVNKIHRHRLTVVSHRGQEIFRVRVINYRNFPTYVQRMIDRFLRPYRQFCKAYVDDIVIFSSFLDEHVKHLDNVFFFSEKNIHLTGHKSFLGYFSTQLFGQKIDALKLTTTENKFRVIFLFFPKTFVRY